MNQGVKVPGRDPVDLTVLHGDRRLVVRGIGHQGGVTEEIARLEYLGNVLLSSIVHFPRLYSAFVQQIQVTGIASFPEHFFLLFETEQFPVPGKIPDGIELSGLLEQTVNTFYGLLVSLLKHLALFQPAFNGVQQLILRKRLRQIIIGPRFHTFPYLGTFGFCGQENKGDRGCGGLPAQVGQYLVAVHFGHHYIANDEIRYVLPRKVKSFPAVIGRDHLIIGEFHYFGGVLPDILVVLDQ